MKNHKYIKVKIIDLQGLHDLHDLHGGAWFSQKLKEVGEYVGETASQVGEYIGETANRELNHLKEWAKEKAEWARDNPGEAILLTGEAILTVAEIKDESGKIPKFMRDARRINNSNDSEAVKYFKIIQLLEERKENFSTSIELSKKFLNEFKTKNFSEEYHALIDDVTSIDMLIFRTKELKKIYDNLIILILIFASILKFFLAYLEWNNKQKVATIIQDFINQETGNWISYIVEGVKQFALIHQIPIIADDKIQSIIEKLIEVNDGPLKGFSENYTTPGYVWILGWIRKIPHFMSQLLYTLYIAQPYFQQGGASLPSNPNELHTIDYLKAINNSFLGKIPQKLFREYVLNGISKIFYRIIIQKLTLLSNLHPNISIVINPVNMNFFDLVANYTNLYNSRFLKKNVTNRLDERFEISKKIINGIIHVSGSTNEIWFKTVSMIVTGILLALVVNISTKIASKIDFIVVIMAMILFASIMIPSLNIYESVGKIANPQIEISEIESEEDGEGIITKDPKIFESILLKLISIIMYKIPKVKSKEEFKETADKIVKIGLLELNKLNDKTPEKEVKTDITEE